MNKIMKWMHIQYEYYYGLHSNFPKCCVKQYVKEQCIDGIYHTAYHRCMTHGIDFHTPHDRPKYVLCDDCMKQYLNHNIVKDVNIHYCDNSTLCKIYEWIRKTFIVKIYKKQFEEHYKQYGAFVSTVPT